MRNTFRSTLGLVHSLLIQPARTRALLSLRNVVEGAGAVRCDSHKLTPLRRWVWQPSLSFSSCPLLFALSSINHSVSLSRYFYAFYNIFCSLFYPCCVNFSFGFTLFISFNCINVTARRYLLMPIYIV